MTTRAHRCDELGELQVLEMRDQAGGRLKIYVSRSTSPVTRSTGFEEETSQQAAVLRRLKSPELKIFSARYHSSAGL